MIDRRKCSSELPQAERVSANNGHTRLTGRAWRNLAQLGSGAIVWALVVTRPAERWPATSRSMNCQWIERGCIWPLPAWQVGLGGCASLLHCCL